MKTFNVQTSYATYPDCHLVVDAYQNNGHIALEIWSDEEGPITNLTVNIAGVESMPENVSCVDTNNFPEALAIIRQLKIGKPLEGKFLRSGWCIYPMVEFNLDSIRKYAGK